VDAGFVCNKAAVMKDKIKGIFCIGNKWIVNAMGTRQNCGMCGTERFHREAETTSGRGWSFYVSVTNSFFYMAAVKLRF
jgi:hypothetical protein